ncbi:MAG: peptidase M61 [Salinimicrobium sp.]
MKKFAYALTLLFAVYGCKTSQVEPAKEQPIITSLDLVNVMNDKVQVTLDPGPFKTDTTVFYIPKIVPGTYATSNFGSFAEDVKAYDYNGTEMSLTKLDENSWSIPNAQKLDRISYLVNDTFDVQGEGGIYSMAGTNILKDKNFLLNLHGFVGYFKNMKEEDYRLEITRPADMVAGSALNIAQTLPVENSTAKKDIFYLDRYFEVTDNPIMYAAPDTTSFDVQGMEVLLDVYSPNNSFSAADLKPAMERMVTAQKNFLGDINSTSKYAILLYLSPTPGQGDAGNFGALEHHTSTVVVMPGTMEKEALNESMTDIVSHEFFHIITPLGVHSNEIHYFDFNEPKMSQHLWMYEGVTEYFANLFQVNQGLITNDEFYARMVDKINTSKRYDDTMPFTEMSKNILSPKYHSSYNNVYQKGALIGMALDIRLRELSNGSYGILDLMKDLTNKYGKDKPFKDEELIPAIVELTYPEIREFFDSYVSGSTPIPYDKFFEKVGLKLAEGDTEVDYFLKNQSAPYVTLDAQGNLIVRNDLEMNSFMKEVGLKPMDRIKSINGTAYNASNIYDLIIASQSWKVGDDIKMTVIRDGEENVLESKIIKPMAKGMKLVEMPGAGSEQVELRHAWLKS